MSDWLVRAARAPDLPGVLAVEREAFGEDEEAQLVAELLEDPMARIPGLSLVAVAAAGTSDWIVGHVLFTRANVGGVEAALLAPLAVAPEYQGVGVGGALVREGLERAAALGFGIALVLGHPGYYPRFGFEPAEPFGIAPPYPVEPSEAWMVAELRRGAVAGARGIVHVADALMHEEMWRE